jgi:hypothetical protein
VDLLSSGNLQYRLYFKHYEMRPWTILETVLRLHRAMCFTGHLFLVSSLRILVSCGFCRWFSQLLNVTLSIFLLLHTHLTKSLWSFKWVFVARTQSLKIQPIKSSRYIKIILKWYQKLHESYFNNILNFSWLCLLVLDSCQNSSNKVVLVFKCWTLLFRQTSAKALIVFY